MTLSHTGGCWWFGEPYTTQPLRHGDALELRVLPGCWLPVRFAVIDGVALLTFSLCPEHRFGACRAAAIPACRHHGAAWVIYDRRRQRPVTRGELARGARVYPDLGADAWPTQDEAQGHADALNDAVEPRGRIVPCDEMEVRALRARGDA